VSHSPGCEPGAAIPRSEGLDSSFMRKKQRANNGSADHVHGARKSPMKTWSTTAIRLLLGAIDGARSGDGRGMPPVLLTEDGLLPLQKDSVQWVMHAKNYSA